MLKNTAEKQIFAFLLINFKYFNNKNFDQFILNIVYSYCQMIGMMYITNGPSIGLVWQLITININYYILNNNLYLLSIVVIVLRLSIPISYQFDPVMPAIQNLSLSIIYMFI